VKQILCLLRSQLHLISSPKYWNLLNENVQGFFFSFDYTATPSFFFFIFFLFVGSDNSKMTILAICLFLKMS